MKSIRRNWGIGSLLGPVLFLELLSLLAAVNPQLLEQVAPIFHAHPVAVAEMMDRGLQTQGLADATDRMSGWLVESAARARLGNINGACEEHAMNVTTSRTGFRMPEIRQWGQMPEGHRAREDPDVVLRALQGGCLTEEEDVRKLHPALKEHAAVLLELIKRDLAAAAGVRSWEMDVTKALKTNPEVVSAALQQSFAGSEGEHWLISDPVRQVPQELWGNPAVVKALVLAETQTPLWVVDVDGRLRLVGPRLDGPVNRKYAEWVTDFRFFGGEEHVAVGWIHSWEDIPENLRGDADMARVGLELGWITNFPEQVLGPALFDRDGLWELAVEKSAVPVGAQQPRRPRGEGRDPSWPWAEWESDEDFTTDYGEEDDVDFYSQDDREQSSSHLAAPDQMGEPAIEFEHRHQRDDVALFQHLEDDVDHPDASSGDEGGDEADADDEQANRDKSAANKMSFETRGLHDEDAEDRASLAEEGARFGRMDISGNDALGGTPLPTEDWARGRDPSASSSSGAPQGRGRRPRDVDLQLRQFKVNNLS